MDRQFLMEEANRSCLVIVQPDLSNSQIRQELFPLTKEGVLISPFLVAQAKRRVEKKAELS